jgi:hypothetical protein
MANKLNFVVGTIYQPYNRNVETYKRINVGWVKRSETHHPKADHHIPSSYVTQKLIENLGSGFDKAAL